MDKLGKLYTVNKYYWYVFPDKHIAMAALNAYSTYESCLLSKQSNSHVGFLKPNDVVVLLKNEKDCREVLLSNGQIGWISYYDWCSQYFEEPQK